MIENLEKTINQLRKKKPLVLNLTNYVTIDFMANSLLALGAAPIMSTCFDELEELVKLSDAININIGTLDETFIEQCIAAVQFTKQYNKPVVLDPVGAGATNIRTSAAKNLSHYASIIKGNASEIIALATDENQTKGVESTHTTQEAQMSAISLAKKNNCVVVVSGAIDFITDGEKTLEIKDGSSQMTLVTGMGCALTAVIAAMTTIVNNPFDASVMGTYFFALCGKLAAESNPGPGSYRTAFIDTLHSFDFKKMMLKEKEFSNEI
ncbi:MAG: hydroxyethylthiazole kinase [Gammaproteobacteria bacterium]